MSSTEIAVIVFGCVCGGALLGMGLRIYIPDLHLNEHSKEVIKLGMGLVATVAALVLGLVIATAKSSYDTQVAAVKSSAAKVLLLDRVLAAYGPETQETRALLRETLAHRLEAIWPTERSQRAQWGGPEPGIAPAGIEARILRLAPQTDSQRWLQAQALRIGGELMETRWLILGGQGSSIPGPFLVVVVFWLTLIFGSFGLLAPRNATVVTVLLLCALSVAGSIFLILEMDQPFQGLMKVSSAPLRYALGQLGQ